jgi:CDP-glycerol glycerophosphotransferase (TagB/SpsB family)
MSDLVVLLRIGLVRLGFLAGRWLPLRRRVVLASATAGHLGDNLLAIRDALTDRAPDIDMTVSAHRPGSGLRGKAVAAVRAAVAGFQLATSRLFIVDDYYFPIYAVRPRSGTHIVQVWHASGAFKKMGYSLSGKTFGAEPAVLRRVRIHANYDLCLVSTQRVIPHYAEAFRLPPERFTSRIGIPRTDGLCDPSWREQAADRVRRRYALPDGRRVILYAPTFRGERTTEARHASGLDIGHLRDVLGDDHVLLLRLHPFVRERIVADETLADFVRDASDHPDIHELMTASDLLLTDYSSAIFEFSLLGRPIAFFAPDHEHYERERGFYLAYPEDLPGPVFEQTEPLAAYVREGRFDPERVERFARDSFDVADGRAAARFVDEIALPALGRDGA